MISKLTFDIRFFVLVISLVTFPVVAFGHDWGLNALGYYNNKKTGGYHCHQGDDSSSSLGSLKPSMNEDFYNMALARKLDGETEATFEYEYDVKGHTPLIASIQIDIVTDEYVIEGRKDKRSGLDSIQQAVFASTLADKKPAATIYDADGRWGKYENRV